MSTKADFGFLPVELDFRACDIAVETLPDFDEAVASVREVKGGIDGDGIYAPLKSTRGGFQLLELPYPSRVFALPKTHSIRRVRRDKGPWHLDFHVWVLSFFHGMRLTTTETGFIDATPIKPGVLTDFALLPRDLPKAVALADEFWLLWQSEPLQAKRLAGAIHALFLAQYPQAFQFEQFIYLYAALDACYRLTAAAAGLTKDPSHPDRVPWMCEQFGMPVPEWAVPADNRRPRTSEVADIRNPVTHEALFMGEPFGFAYPGFVSEQNLPLQMRCLVCRLLVGLKHLQAWGERIG
jgi:hypothetical protein